jgi:3-oxoacyl-[acyl-carrier-protein] synthase III
MNIDEFQKVKNAWIEELAQAMVATMDEMKISPKELEWFNPLLYSAPTEED